MDRPEIKDCMKEIVEQNEKNNYFFVNNKYQTRILILLISKTINNKTYYNIKNYTFYL